MYLMKYWTGGGWDRICVRIKLPWLVQDLQVFGGGEGGQRETLALL